jgi:hypothetical protein
MNRLRQRSLVCLVLVAVTGLLIAADPPTSTKVDEQKWQLDRELTISPQAEPHPALKYRLMPLASELKEGNAVPIYLRLGHEQNDESRKYWMETPLPWNDLSLDKVPLADAHKYLDRMGWFLQQIDYGARRKSAEWSYTIEQPDPISILLPDLQQMRGFAPLLVTRTRVQIAEHDYVAAARSFETGFAFSRHTGEEGPFIIGSLVGIAIANMHVDRIPEWIEQPNSPNLYWSLTALPRPFIGLRRQLEFEQRVADMQFPDLADLDRPRSAAEWDAGLKRFRAEVKRIEPMLQLTEGLAAPNSPPQPTTPPQPKEAEPADPDQPAAQSPDLPAARKFVAERWGKVDAMPPAQVLLLYIAGTYADVRDDVFKITYLAFPQAHSQIPKVAQRMREITMRVRKGEGGEGLRLARMFLPAIQKVFLSQNRLDRKISLLRTVEALRLYAVAHDGQLPDGLDQVKEVPIPLDPGTGQPFEYHRDGPTATISSRLPDESLAVTGLRYRLTMRK